MSEGIRRPLFADLVYNEEGQPVEAVYIGGVPYYTVPDKGFLRHVEAVEVDRQVLAQLRERILPMREAVTQGIMRMLGRDNLFTKAAVDMAIDDMDKILDQREADLGDMRMWLAMMGFKVVVNVHGEVVKVDFPGMESGLG